MATTTAATATATGDRGRGAWEARAAVDTCAVRSAARAAGATSATTYVAG